MRIYVDAENLVIITSSKTIRFDLTIKINKSLKCDIKFIISRSKSLADYTTKN